MKEITDKEEVLKIMYNVLRNSFNEYKIVDRSGHSVTYINDHTGQEFVICDRNHGYTIYTRFVD